MEFTKFARKPFTVEAIEITVENIEELSQFIGEVRLKEDGQPYIQVDRRKVPNVYKVYPGFWMTKMANNVRCYSAHVFQAQFVENTPEIEILSQQIAGRPDQVFPDEGKMQEVV